MIEIGGCRGRNMLENLRPQLLLGTDL